MSRVVSSTSCGIENLGTVERASTFHIESGPEFLTGKIQRNWKVISLVILHNATGLVLLHFLRDSWQGWASVGASIVISTTILLLGAFTGSVGTAPRWKID
jgi:hypothetical protein